MPVPTPNLDQLTAQTARAVGAAFAEVVVRAERAVVVGHDSSPVAAELAAEFAAGLSVRGVDALLVGPCSADVLAFGSGSLELPGAMFSAAGVSLLTAEARPKGSAGAGDPARAAVLERAGSFLAGQVPEVPEVEAPALGRTTRRDLLPAYSAFLRSLVDLSGIRPLRVAVAGDADAARTVAAVLGTGAGLGALPLVLLPAASPIEVRADVVGNDADLGIALDLGAGRLAVVDEHGDPVSPSVVAAVIGLRAVERERQEGNAATVVHDVLTSRAVTDLLTASGATVVAARGGTSVPAELAALSGVVGIESDGRYWFRDVYLAPSPMLAAMHVLAAVGGHGAPLSALAEAYQPYFGSGELVVGLAGDDDVVAARDRVVEAYVTRQGAGPVLVDGPIAGSDGSDPLTISHWDESPRWWFSLRTVGGEGGAAGLALTVEAADEDIMEKVREDVLALVRAAKA